MRFWYKHCNFSLGCLVVKVASKNVTKCVYLATYTVEGLVRGNPWDLKNKLREFDNRSKHFLFSDHFFNSHNHFSWQHIEIGRRKLMLVTVVTYRVHCMQKFDGEDYRPALPVFFSGERAMAGSCCSPLPLPPPPHLLRSPTKSPAPGGYSREFWVGVCREGSDPI